MRERRTLLVLRPLGLGDFLTGIPAYRALARAFPAHRRVLAAPAALAPLLRAAGAFHDLLDAAPLARLRDAPTPIDVAVNLHGRGPQSHRVLLQLRPRALLAFAHRDVPESRGGPRWCADEHEVQRWCRMLRAHGVLGDPTDLDLRIPDQPSFGSGYLLIHPGAASVARRWPAERWAAVARHERAWRPVIVTGGPGEAALSAEVALRAGLPPDDVHAGQHDLLALAALVRGASLVVCGDTDVAHLATALRRPSVLLFGSTAPALWGPPPERSWHRVIWRGRESRAHADRLDPGLLAITVEEVLAEIAALSGARPGLAARRGEPRGEVRA